jgi:3-hydroxyacyl-[acyl-carrier-protein] dehydratase
MGGEGYTRTPNRPHEVVTVRFVLIDRVLERQPDRLVAIKNVTAAEEYLGDHFPGFPVLPGVMMLEALVQAGRTLLAGIDPAPERPLVLAEVRNIRYGNMVRPGQSLRVEVSLKSGGKPGGDGGEPGWEFTGTGTVDGQVAVQGRFTLKPLAE